MRATDLRTELNELAALETPTEEQAARIREARSEYPTLDQRIATAQMAGPPNDGAEPREPEPNLPDDNRRGDTKLMELATLANPGMIVEGSDKLLKLDAIKVRVASLPGVVVAFVPALCGEGCPKVLTTGYRRVH